MKFFFAKKVIIFQLQNYQSSLLIRKKVFSLIKDDGGRSAPLLCWIGLNHHSHCIEIDRESFWFKIHDFAMKNCIFHSHYLNYAYTPFRKHSFLGSPLALHLDWWRRRISDLQLCTEELLELTFQPICRSHSMELSFIALMMHLFQWSSQPQTTAFLNIVNGTLSSKPGSDKKL